MRWTIWYWVQYLRHPRSLVYIRIVGETTIITSGEGTEIF